MKITVQESLDESCYEYRDLDLACIMDKYGDHDDVKIIVESYGDYDYDSNIHFVVSYTREETEEEIAVREAYEQKQEEKRLRRKEKRDAKKLRDAPIIAARKEKEKAEAIALIEQLKKKHGL